MKKSYILNNDLLIQNNLIDNYLVPILNLIDSKGAIIASFTRSYDSSHISKNIIHLIASALYLNSFSKDIFISALKHEDEEYTTKNKCKYIIFVVDNRLQNIELKEYIKFETNLFRKDYKKAVIILIDINSFISHIKLSKGNSLFANIFGDKDLNKKDFELIHQNTIFIFPDLIWSNILLSFKLEGVNIGGGNISKRHIISTIEYQLINNLSFFGFNEELIQRAIYNSNSNPVLNKNMDSKLYKELFIFKNKTFTTKYSDIQKIEELFKEYSLYPDSILNEKNKITYAYFLHFLNVNINLYFKILQEDIKKSFNSNLGSMKKEINDLIKQKLDLEYQLKSLDSIFTMSTKFMSRQEKKNFKLKRKIYSSSDIQQTEAEDIKIKLQEISSLIEEKEAAFNIQHSKFLKIYNNLESKSLEELMELSFNFSNNKIKNKFKKEELNFYNKNLNSKNSIRSFSSKAIVKSSPFFIPSPVSKADFSLVFNFKRNFSTNRSIESSNFLNSLLKQNKISFDSLFFNFLESTIKESELNSYQSQYKLESQWKDYILDKLNTVDNKSRKSLSYVIKKANETLTLQIEKNKIKNKFPQISQELNKRHLIISYSIITTYFNKLGFTAIAMKIGNEILFDIYSKEWRNLIVNNYIPFNNYLKEKSIDEIFILNLGSHFIEIFSSKPTLLFSRVFKKRERDVYSEEEDLMYDSLLGNDIAVLEINEEYLDFISNNNIITPASLPMLSPPNKWSDLEFGGFLENKEDKNSLITGSSLHKHNMEEKENLYKCINKLNSVKFKINKELLDYLENEGSYLLDYYFKNQKDKTNINQSFLTLKLAKAYSKLKSPFYISCNADWRGRVYTQSFYITYQGGDLASAFVNLYEGFPLTKSGLEYLYIFGANCYDEKNLSKQSFETRIKWVKDNYDNIINLNKDFILKAKNIFLFTSFCLNLRKYHFNKNEVIYLPIFLDATCSGIQHLSALLEDMYIGTKVNLIAQTKKDKVEDLYSSLVEPINKAINLKGENNPEFKNFKYIKLNRKNIKTSIMTKVYNVSIVGMADQLRSSFEKITINKIDYYLTPSTDENTKIQLSRRDTYVLAEIIYKQVFISFPSLEEIYVYFKEIAKICLYFNIPLIWFTPSGLKISQHYSLTIQNKVSISFKNKSKSVVLRESTNKIDNRKQVQAIIPNIIHSLDASHLMNIINKGLDENIDLPILTVHDCFGTHPNFIANLKNLVTSEFVLLYTKNKFLETFHERILQSFKDNQFVIYEDDKGTYIKPIRKKYYLPKLPKNGELNLRDILNSEYFIT